MPRTKRFLMLLPLIAAFAAIASPAARASTSQTAIFEDDAGLLGASAPQILAQIKTLGATEVRVSIAWADVATESSQPGNASSPSSYPAKNWAPYDAIDKLAAADHIKLDFDILAPAPNFALGKGAPKGIPPGIWKPSAADFGSFVKAVGTRYSGHFDGLPKVSFWSIWNEPNYGQDLAPATNGSGSIEYGAAQYRGLVNHAFSALNASGHRGDTILFGEVAPHGYEAGGNTNVVAPLKFLRFLYCVGSNLKPLTGALAKANSCPTTAAASKKFRSQNSPLFSAKGFSAHLYAQGNPPNETLPPRSPCAKIDKADSADLGAIGNLTKTLDKVNTVYGSHTKFPIWNTEYGFQTDPPETPACNVRPVSQTTAALYINWAEYLSYKNPRIASYDQYLLVDPPLDNFASGLEFANGAPKADYDAYQIPLFMPVTSGKSGSSLEVWGDARPVPFGGAHNVLVEFTPTGGSPAFTSVNVSSKGYFDTHIKFTQSGTVRVVWKDAAATDEFSRSQSVTIG